MHLLDTIAMVGEVLSWVGLGAGVPAILLALMIGLVEGPWRGIEIAVIDRDESRIARWFAGGDFHERLLRRDEAFAEPGWHDGYVSGNDPGRARIGSRPHLRRVLWTLGIVFTSVGVLGLMGSLLPLLVAA